LAALAALAAATAGNAYAQSSSAEAEQLFRDGKRLMKEGKYGEACDAFESSQKADAAITTLLNLADCREKNGQIASAWGAFLDAERLARSDAKQAKLGETAHDRAKKLEQRLSYLTVSVPEESRVEGLALSRNGDALDIGKWNRAIPVDGGDYTVTGQAPGHEAWSTVVHVANENDSVTVDVPKFKVVDELMTEPETAAQEVVAPEDEDLAQATPQSSFTGRRKLAVGVGAAGLLAIGGGIVLGLQAKGFESDAAERCPMLTGCANADAANVLVDKANQRALFADVAFGVGAAAVVGAVVLWLTGAPDRAAGETALTPFVNPTSTGVAVTGSF
jgi:hypothetical protein